MIKCGKDRKISNFAGDGEEHSMIWGMFMVVTMESATFMGKNFQNNRNSIVNTADLSHLNKSSTYLRNWCRNKMRSQVWKRLVWKNIHGNKCH